jgi:hypothetical protein
MRPELQAILRKHLKKLLDADLEQHLRAPAGSAVYASAVGEYEDPVDADLALIGNLLDDAREALARREIQSVAEDAAALVDELTGHEGKGTSRKVYKKDMPLSVLFEAISKVEWSEIKWVDKEG